jgi:hypothetical protein
MSAFSPSDALGPAPKPPLDDGKWILPIGLGDPITLSYAEKIQKPPPSAAA